MPQGYFGVLGLRSVEIDHVPEQLIEITAVALQFNSADKLQHIVEQTTEPPGLLSQDVQSDQGVPLAAICRLLEILSQD